jgi:hypothetical protein
VTDTLILTAIRLEARGLARELELQRRSGFPFPVFERPGRGLIRLAPVGLRAALLPASWAALIADLVSPLVISAGTCGGLAPELEVGDLVLPESVLGPSGERLNVTPGVHAAALGLSGSARTGLLLTSSALVETPEAKALRWRATGASAVDMESAAILAWASRQGCSSLVVRAVSDTAHQRVPAELAGLVTQEGTLLPGKAVALALTRPRTVPQAFVLRRGTRTALKRVAGFLATLLR